MGSEMCIRDRSEGLRFHMQPSFHATDHFEHALGITVLGDAKPERVEFLCDPLLGKYLTSQPLHHSQRIVESSNEVRVTLNVMPTFELLQWLQAHANELTLLAPQSIKQSVVKTLETALERQKRG